MLKLIKKFLKGNNLDFKTLVQNGAVIVDVRNNAEFRSGHIKGALNIPVEQIRVKTADLKNMNKPIITCCKSGIRSGMAASILTSAGVEVYNGGPWNVLQGRI